MIRHGSPYTLAEIDELDALSRQRALTLEESSRLERLIERQNNARRNYRPKQRGLIG